jgi:hypothetical protein
MEDSVNRTPSKGGRLFGILQFHQRPAQLTQDPSEPIRRAHTLTAILLIPDCFPTTKRHDRFRIS